MRIHLMSRIHHWLFLLLISLKILVWGWVGCGENHMLERTNSIVETRAACGSANDEPSQGRCPISGTPLTFSGYYDKIDDWYFQLVSEEETSHPSTG